MIVKVQFCAPVKLPGALRHTLVTAPYTRFHRVNSDVTGFRNPSRFPTRGPTGQISLPDDFRVSNITIITLFVRKKQRTVRACQSPFVTMYVPTSWFKIQRKRLRTPRVLSANTS